MYFFIVNHPAKKSDVVTLESAYHKDKCSGFLFLIFNKSLFQMHILTQDQCFVLYSRMEGQVLSNIPDGG